MKYNETGKKTKPREHSCKRKYWAGVMTLCLKKMQNKNKIVTNKIKIGMNNYN